MESTRTRWARASRAAVFGMLGALLGGCAAAPRRPESLDAWRAARMERAYALERGNRPGEAAALCEEVLARLPADRDARLELAYLDVRLQRWQDAVNRFGSLIDESPDDMRLRMQRGYARLALGDPSAAADDFLIVARAPGEFQEQARGALDQAQDASSIPARGARRDALLNEGYDALRRGDNAVAREKFEAALQSDPGHVETEKQLGYMSAEEGDDAEAARRFEGARLLAPDDDTTALQLGYLYDSLHDEAAAEKWFTEALKSSDKNTRADAEAALRNIQMSRRPLSFDVYASPFYTSRYQDKIAFAEAKLLYRPDPDWPASFYLGGRYTQDSRSHRGSQNEIFQDNVASIGPGIRIQPNGWGLNLSVEWDAAANLMTTPEHPRAAEGDVQAVLADYGDWPGRLYGPIGLMTGYQWKPHRAFTDAGLSVGYYARYRDNVIGYLQEREGFKAWDNRQTIVNLYVPVNVVKDTKRDFFNNVVETGGGVELQPWIRVSLRLRAEYLHGFYMGIQGRDRNPYGSGYDDFRLTLVYAAHFANPRPDPEDDDFTPDKKRRPLW